MLKYEKLYFLGSIKVVGHLLRQRQVNIQYLFSYHLSVILRK